MIRNIILKTPILKVPLKKELKFKNYRFITYMCKSQRKKISNRQEKLGFVKAAQSTLNFNNVRFYCDHPNHYKISLPALSPTMESGTIIRWEKKEGDKLNEGDLLAEIETDKATMGFETPEEGYLAKILVPAGTKNVPIGKLVCIIVENETDVAAFKNYTDSGDSSSPSTSPKSSPPAEVFTSTHQTASSPTSSPPPSPFPPPPISLAATPSTPSVKLPQNRVFASPLAKKIAEEKGLSLENINVGSGIYGSIKAKNVEEAEASYGKDILLSNNRPYEDIELSSIRNVIAKRLVLSKQTIPHYYLSVDINVDNVLKIRKKINALNEKNNIKLSINDFVIKAMALACKKVPEANSSWCDTFIRQYNTVDVSVAVNTNKGLITPIIFDADTKGLSIISSEMKILAAKAREGMLKPHEFQGGTISLSNLGMFGINNFSAIINPPQTCLLAVGCIDKRLVPDSENEKGFRVSEFMSVTLSCDHRTLDGAVGAQWLSIFRTFLEDPDHMLL